MPPQPKPQFGGGDTFGPIPTASRPSPQMGMGTGRGRGMMAEDPMQGEVPAAGGS